MYLKFSKYHGCGNDFICIDSRHKNYDLNELSKEICRRHFSVGADGLVVLLDSNKADFKMKIINADGSIPEMCGNGLRCFIHYLVDTNESVSDSYEIETDAGILHCEVSNKKKDYIDVKIDMGKVQYFDRLPAKDFQLLTDKLDFHSIKIGDEELEFIPISIGNPHAVFFVSDVESINVNQLGPLIERNPIFPNRVNVEFVEVFSDEQLKMRVWERGVGETNACGTGACASVVAAHLKSYVKSNVNVQLLGGKLQILFDKISNDVILEGPSQFVFSSEYYIKGN